MSDLNTLSLLTRAQTEACRIHTVDDILPTLCLLAASYAGARYVEAYLCCSLEELRMEEGDFLWADSSSNSSRRLTSRSDARFLGISVDQVALCNRSASLRRGPMDLRDYTVGDDGDIIAINASGCANVLIWYHVVVDQDRIDTTRLAMLSEGLRSCSDLLLNLGLNHALRNGKRRQAEFYYSLLAIDPVNTEISQQEVAQSWLKAFDASWVWLWVYNPLSAVWELSEVAPKESRFLPKRLPRIDTGSVLSFVHKHSRPQYIPSLDWEHTDANGARYAITQKQELRDLGSSSFWCVPLSAQLDEARTAGPRHLQERPPKASIDVVISIHLPEGTRTPANNYLGTDIMLMAALSAHILYKSDDRPRQNLLIRLNSISEKYLADRKQAPRSIRRACLDAVLDLICSEVGCRAASLFVQNSSGSFLEFMASSRPLYAANGDLLTAHQMQAIRYAPGYGETGRAWRSSIPKSWRIGETLGDSYRPTSAELNLRLQSAGGCLSASAVIYPIRRSSAAKASGDPSDSIGVIRCGDAFRTVGNRQESVDFNASRLQTLHFIASQIGPILEALNAAVWRDHSVNQTKHDLVMPADEISRRVQRILDWQRATLAEQSKVYESLLNCVTIASYDAQNMTDWLPTARRTIELLEKTALVGIPESFRREPEADEAIRSEARIHGPVELNQGALRHQLRNLEQDSSLIVKMTEMLDSGKEFLETFTPEPTYLEGAIIARLRGGFALSAERKGMHISFESFAGVIPKLKVDRVFVERVLRNVLDNAIKYGDPNSDVLVRPRSSHDKYCIDVESNGIGIASEDCESIFVGNYRSPTAIASREKGRGLGLMMARRMMERHGGSLVVTHLTRPTVFTLSFPKSLRVE